MINTIKEQFTSAFESLNAAFPLDNKNTETMHNMRNYVQDNIITRMQSNLPLTLMDINATFNRLYEDISVLEKKNSMILSAQKQAFEKIHEVVFATLQPPEEASPTIDSLMSNGVPKNKKDRKKLKNQIMKVARMEENKTPETPQLSTSAVILNMKNMKDNNDPPVDSNKNKP